MSIYCVSYKIRLQRSLRLIHTKTFSIHTKTAPHRGAVSYITLTVSMRVLHHRSHAYPTRLDYFILYVMFVLQY